MARTKQTARRRRQTMLGPTQGRVEKSKLDGKARLRGQERRERRKQRKQRKRELAAMARLARQQAQSAVPPLVVVVPATASADPKAAIGAIREVLEGLNCPPHPRPDTLVLPPKVHAPNTPPHFTVLPIAPHLPPRAFARAVLAATRVADAVLIQFHGEEEVLTPQATASLALLRAQGLPTVRSIITDPPKKSKDLRLAHGKRLFAHSLAPGARALRPLPIPTDLFAPGARSDVSNSLRTIFSRPFDLVSWRERYSYTHVDSAALHAPPASAPRLRLSGYVRGRPTTANRLLHLSGFGTFVVREICRGTDGPALSVRDEEGEDVRSEAEPDWTAQEQTWPPEDMHGLEMEPPKDPVKPRRRRDPGVSDYQATWVDDLDEEDAEREEKEAQMMTDAEGGEANGGETEAQVKKEVAMTERENEQEGMEGVEGIGEEGDGDGDGDFEDELDEKVNMEIDEDEVRRVRQEAKTDVMFPDEVDTPIDQLASECFAGYRGLASMRTSPWDPKENLPEEYGRIYQFKNFVSTAKKVMQRLDEEEREEVKGVVQTGQYVTFVVDVTDVGVAEQIVKTVEEGVMPVVAVSLLKHENKKSVMHFSLQRVDNKEERVAIECGQVLEFHCGFVQYLARPMFSEQNQIGDKHKMERFLHRGRRTMASVYGKAIYPPSSVLVFRPDGDLVATGSSLGADPDRIILKRVVLTGYVYKSHKKKATVRYMFFNREDVLYFKPVQLFTKFGRTGRILEPLGTHGYFKCEFDDFVQHHDVVCMSLYKRVYPENPLVPINRPP